MAITLANIQETAQDDIDFALIDETRRDSTLLNLLTFDDSTVPDTTGGNLTKGYTRLKNKRAADTRQENHEYPAREATRQRVTVDLVPMGARYNIDRVYARLGAASTNQVVFQQDQARLATIAKFNDLFINGVSSDFTTDVPEFDGLDAIVTGTTTESFATGTTPWDFSNITTKEQAMVAKRALRAWLAQFDGSPTLFFVNKDGKAFLEELGDWMGYYTEGTNDLGTAIQNYNGVPFLDLGEKDGSSADVIGTDDNGVTSIYAARLGLDSVHGYSVQGGQILSQWLPDYDTAGAVKPGEVELGPVAIAAKRTRGVGAFRVKIGS